MLPAGVFARLFQDFATGFNRQVQCHCRPGRNVIPKERQGRENIGMLLANRSQEAPADQWPKQRKETRMAGCYEMKKGDIYVCEDCGLEIQIIKECTDCDPNTATCGCEDCSFVCCDKEMVKK